jgi:hypothetical protein
MKPPFGYHLVLGGFFFGDPGEVIELKSSPSF